MNNSGPIQEEKKKYCVDEVRGLQRILNADTFLASSIYFLFVPSSIHQHVVVYFLFLPFVCLQCSFVIYFPLFPSSHLSSSAILLLGLLPIFVLNLMSLSSVNCHSCYSADDLHISLTSHLTLAFTAVCCAPSYSLSLSFSLTDPHSQSLPLQFTPVSAFISWENAKSILTRRVLSCARQIGWSIYLLTRFGCLCECVSTEMHIVRPYMSLRVLLPQTYLASPVQM